MIMMTAPVQAMSLTDQVKLIKNTYTTCGKYGVKCNVKVIDTKQLIAQSNINNEIKYSTGILDYLSYNQMRSVTYHEIAHLKLKHSEKTRDLLFSSFQHNKRIPRWIYIQHKHNNEYQADWLASYMMLTDNVPNHLDTALLLLTPQQHYYKQSVSHPSTYNRVRMIHHYKQAPKTFKPIKSFR